jgi:hypothetical protein
MSDNPIPASQHTDPHNPAAGDAAHTPAQTQTQLQPDADRWHTAFERLHDELGEINGLAEAAYQAVAELPRFDSPAGRRAIRSAIALVRACHTTAMDSLQKWDRWIDKVEGRAVYYETPATGHEEEIDEI